MNSTSKTLSQAFLRAYAKDNRRRLRIPAPHAFGSADRDSQREHRAPDVSAEHHEPELPQMHVTAATTVSAADTIPAPHITFPPTYAVSAPELGPQQALLLNQIDTAALMNGPLPAASQADHHELPVARTPQVEIHNDPPQSPLAPQHATTRYSLHPPHEAPKRDIPPTTSAAVKSAAMKSAAMKSAAVKKAPVSAQAAAAPLAPPASKPDVVEFATNVGATQAAWEVDHFGWTDECNELFHSLGTAFDEAGEQLRSVTLEGLHVLAVSSTYRGEGRTMVASLLARAAARAGVSVALFDADVENPQIAAHLKIELAADWLTTLHDKLPLEEAAVASTEENIIAYPLRAEAREQVVCLNDADVVRLLRGVAETVELVIVDLGPYTSDQRRMILAGSACPIDAAIVVRDVRSTTAEQASLVAQGLRQLGVEAVGIAENFVRN